VSSSEPFVTSSLDRDFSFVPLSKPPFANHKKQRQKKEKRNFVNKTSPDSLATPCPRADSNFPQKEATVFSQFPQNLSNKKSLFFLLVSTASN